MNWKNIGVFILIFVVLLGLANLLFRFALPIKAVFLISGSMEPTYSANDVLFWKQADSYYLNDVVIFKRNFQADVVSRIVNVNDDGTFNLKGDHNPLSINFEKELPKESIKGLIVFSLSSFIFYGLTYGIIFALSFLSVRFIFKKKKAQPYEL